MATTWKEASSEPATPRDKGTRPVVRDYMIVSLLALLFITLILWEEGFGAWSVLPLLLGGVGIVASWPGSPPLVLFALVMLLMKRSWIQGVHRHFQGEPSLVIDLMLAATTLVYLAGAMRLLTLVRHATPPDVHRSRKPPASRVAGRWLLPKEPAGRSLLEVPANEIVVLLTAAPCFVVLAYVLWYRLASEGEPPGWLEPLPLPGAWHALLLAWGVGIALVAMHAFLSYLSRAQATREESLLYLQDQLWQETRGEQRRLNRWLAWARLRWQWKGEKS